MPRRHSAQGCAEALTQFANRFEPALLPARVENRALLIGVLTAYYWLRFQRCGYAKSRQPARADSS